MKYILNLRNKTNYEVSSLIDNAGFPAIIGGGQKNEPVKLFIEDTEEELLELIGSSEPNYEEVFDITYATGSGSGSGSGSGYSSGSGSGSGSGNDEQQYTITFKNYIDLSTIYQETGTTGTKVEIPTPPVVEGQIFSRWTIEGGSQVLSDATYVTIGESDMTYYANYYTPATGSGSGSGSGSGNDQYYITFTSDIDQYIIGQEAGTNGTEVEIPTPPAYDGYTFSHWAIEGTLEPLSNDVTHVTIDGSNMTYYAIYIPNTGS